MSIPDFDGDGLLPAGVHEATWNEIESRFGGTQHRAGLLVGLKSALASLSRAGCARVYLDGSFVTNKSVPGDFDACWEEAGVDPTKLEPVLLVFDNFRAAQKARFGGELFPASARADPRGQSPFVTFFQTDRSSGRAKGIVAIDLRKWQP